MWKWFVVFVVVLLTGWMSLNSNRRMNLAEEDMEKGLLLVERAYQDRYGLSSNLAISLKIHSNTPDTLTTSIESARQSCIDVSLRKATVSEKDISSFISTHLVLDSVLAVAADSIAARPDLRSDMNINILLKELEVNKADILDATVTYNEGLPGYNTVLSRFPNSLFRGLFGYKKRYPIPGGESEEETPEGDQ